MSQLGDVRCCRALFLFLMVLIITVLNSLQNFPFQNKPFSATP